MSIALGPLGRNGEASSAVNTKGNLAAMYSYSKTKGLFGGLSIEGSVIVERQDANATAYGSSVTVKMLLSGVVPPPAWAEDLIHTLGKCTGLPGGQTWIQDTPERGMSQEYAFGGLASPGSEIKKSKKSKSVSSVSSFPPPSWGSRKDTGSYFDSADQDITPPAYQANKHQSLNPFPRRDSVNFPVQFESHDPFHSPVTTHQPNLLEDDLEVGSSQWSSTTASKRFSNPFQESYKAPPLARSDSASFSTAASPVQTSLSQRPNLLRAIAEYDFKAIEPGDLGFSKGDVIIIIEKSDKTEDWWTGFIDGRKGIFPANFVRLL